MRATVDATILPRSDLGANRLQPVRSPTWTEVVT
jgi:hypothetical protein